jgi:hypothetical protein
VDWVQVADAVAQALGESSDRAEQVLRELFREYAAAPPGDWNGVRQILDSASIVEYGKIDQLLAELKELAGETGDAEDPRGIFEDPELLSHFASAAVTKVPVVEGSVIYQAGEEYYLEQEGQQPIQVWRATSDTGTVYYHDGTNNYDEYGRPLGTPDATSSDAGQPQDHEAWNSFLSQYGSRWNGTEEAWPPFREWFLYYADQNQVGESAQGFIAYAESGDKREVFISYGVTLPAADPAAGPAAAEPDHTHLLRRLHHEVMEPALTEFMAAHPGLAEELGEERLRELLAEVTAGHLESRIGSTTD